MVQAITVDSHAEAADLSTRCNRCSKPLRRGWGFAFNPKRGVRGSAGHNTAAVLFKCASRAIRHVPMLRRSIAVALVVGTILTLLNQGDTIFAANWKNALYWKIPLTYCVPFCVATYGALTVSRR